MNTIEIRRENQKYVVRMVDVFNNKKEVCFDSVEDAEAYSADIMNDLAKNDHSFQYVDMTIGFPIYHESERLAKEILEHPKMLIFDDEDKFEDYIDNSENHVDCSFNYKANKGYVLLK